LEYYATHFRVVEINSSFYRPHRASVYARWRALTPADFRFAVKLPRALSHGPELCAPPPLLEQLVEQVSALGPKLAVLLLQLPPQRRFEREPADRFLTELSRSLPCPLVCEPRHASWFSAAARKLLDLNGVGLVSADPRRSETEYEPTGPIPYFRLHGSPRMYYSHYSDASLKALAERVVSAAAATVDVWCVFDNTAAHAAWDDALKLRRLVRSRALAHQMVTHSAVL
jgi:uncharacterized protein YecE (DUF72 family)